MTVTGPAESILRPNAPAARNPKWTGFNAGMRSTKGNEYDGGHRVPFFIRWPARGIGGKTSREVPPLAAHFDVLPTLVELCGLKFAPKNPLDGRSLAPLLTSAAGAATWPARTLFVHVQREEVPPKWKKSAALTDRWRLINGAELYDIVADPGQKQNVAAQHTDVVAELRADYETWWQSLAPALERTEAIVLGAPGHDRTEINCMDWHARTLAEIPWDQNQIKKMPAFNGWWQVEIARAGRYEFTLRHQPELAHFPLKATTARVQVGDREATAEVAPGATAAVVTLDLPAGDARLQTWLAGQPSGETRGAFFIEAKRLE